MPRKSKNVFEILQKFHQHFSTARKIERTETLKQKQKVLYKESIRSCFFEKKINKMDKPLARLTRGHRDSIQINKFRNETEDITTETWKFQEIIRSYYKTLYSTKLENMDEMDNFLDTYESPTLKQDHINHLNSPIQGRRISDQPLS